MSEHEGGIIEQVACRIWTLLFIPSVMSQKYKINITVDHTRVRLRIAGGTGTTNTKEKDEYLNANFVDGFRRSRAYIATQGPMQSTQNLFWRMVFEQDVKIIVMITHLFEGGKVSLTIFHNKNLFTITCFCFEAPILYNFILLLLRQSKAVNIALNTLICICTFECSFTIFKFLVSN